MEFDIRDDFPKPEETPSTSDRVEAVQEPEFQFSSRTPLLSLHSPTGVRSKIAQNEADKRVKKMEEIFSQLEDKPKGYEMVPQRGQILFLSVLNPSVNPKEQSVFSLVGESGIVLPQGTKIVRAFGFVPGNVIARSITDLEVGERVSIMLMDEDSGVWVQKTSVLPSSKLTVLPYTNVGVRLSGVYHFDDETDDRRTYVGWGETTLTEYAVDERQTAQNTRYVWSHLRFEESGLKRLVRVDRGAQSTASDQLISIAYKALKLDQVPASYTEQVERIRFDDGTVFKASKTGFALCKEVEGRSQYIGTIAEPNFELDEFGNLTYTECLFDERKGETRANDTQPIYRVTKFLDHRELRKRIR